MTVYFSFSCHFDTVYPTFKSLFVFVLCLVYPMLPVFVFVLCTQCYQCLSSSCVLCTQCYQCLSSSCVLCTQCYQCLSSYCVPNVTSVCLRIVYLMLPVCLDCHSWFLPSVFSNVSLKKCVPTLYSHNKTFRNIQSVSML
jgi:hypothetical protein